MCEYKMYGILNVAVKTLNDVREFRYSNSKLVS